MLLERPFPGASTCLLVGRATGELGGQLKGFARVGWIVDAEGARFWPAGVAANAVEVFPLEKFSPHELEAWLGKFVARTPRHLPSLFVTDTAGLPDAARFGEAVALLYRALEGHHRARVTRQKDGFTWQKHVLENLPRYATHRLPARWRGALQGCPAFVCGAGPSLDHSAPHLARVAESGVIFAADSALRTLAKYGLAADFAVSIDAAKFPEKCLPPDHAPARVVLSAVSPPGWKSAVPEERQTFMSSNQVTIDWLATKGLARTEVGVVENCGATALALARHLGCAPIYLFGLDLALDAQQPGRRNTASADASLYTQSGFDAAQDHPEVPGNFSATVPTHVFGDWSALDARLATWPAGLVQNVTDRGARLQNTTVIRPETLEVASPVVSKIAALAVLSDAGATVPVETAAALRELSRVGEQTLASLPGWRQVLDRDGPAGLVNALRPRFGVETFARGFGAFSLKVMPHLVPPIEGDRAFWNGLCDELEILAKLARELK